MVIEMFLIRLSVAPKAHKCFKLLESLLDIDFGVYLWLTYDGTTCVSDPYQGLSMDAQSAVLHCFCL